MGLENSHTLLLLAAVLFAGLLLVLWRFSRSSARRLREGYPGAFAGARLVMSEVDVAIDRPVRIVGRPDEVYLARTGYLVAVETKTRRRAVVRRSDIIQLSAYAVLLRYAQHQKLPGRPGRRGRPVADQGYLRIVTPAGTRWRAVKLAPESEVVRLYNIRIALEQGKAAPRPAQNKAACRRCTYRSVCPVRRRCRP